MTETATGAMQPQQVEDMSEAVREAVMQPGANLASLAAGLVDSHGLAPDDAAALSRAVCDRLLGSRFPPITEMELMLTEACNHCCTYCFVEGKNAAHTMPADVARRGIDFLFTQCREAQDLKVLFFGGEPMMEFDLIRLSVLHACERAAAAGKKMRFHMTTNGTLFDDERMAFLARHGVMCLVSMDGDRAPLQELVALKQEYDAFLLVDEAHSGGALGPQGAGLAAAAGVAEHVDVHVGTLSKAFAGYGGYVAADRLVIDFLVNHARSFIFSTGLSPVVAAALRRAVECVRDGDDRRRRLAENAAFLRAEFQRLRLATGRSSTHIVPVVVGRNRDALQWADALQQEDILAWPIRPPSVAEGSARLRFSLSAAHDREQLQHVVDVLRQQSPG